jgi:hypothetical protein
MNVGGSTLTRTAQASVSQLVRQAVGALTTASAGQTIVVNGGTVVTNAAVNAAAITTAYIGNQQNGNNPLNGYIERIVTGGTTGGVMFTATDLQSNTSVAPLASDIVHDFWNNPVPGAGAGYSIGAHQPVTPTKGATVTLNGATPVTVTDNAVTPNSSILFTLKTVGGTVGAVPSVKTITPGTGFTVAGTAADTSVYNYLIMG